MEPFFISFALFGLACLGFYIVNRTNKKERAKAEAAQAARETLYFNREMKRRITAQYRPSPSKPSPVKHVSKRPVVSRSEPETKRDDGSSDLLTGIVIGSLLNGQHSVDASPSSSVRPEPEVTGGGGTFGGGGASGSWDAPDTSSSSSSDSSSSSYSSDAA